MNSEKSWSNQENRDPEDYGLDVEECPSLMASDDDNKEEDKVLKI